MCRKLIYLISFVLVLGIGSLAQAGLPEWEAAISSANPLHWYKFNETTGTNCVDSGSAGLGGTYDGVTLGVQGHFGAGTAVRFDRSPQNRVNLTGGTDLDTSWTVEYIVMNMKPAAANDSMALHDSDSTSVRLAGWTALGEVGFTLYGVADYQFTPEEGLTLEDLVIPVGEWMHLTWRRDDAGGTQIFFNGKLVGTSTDSVAFPRLRIGGRGGGPADWLDAVLDESVVFGRALTDDEIIAHAASAGLAGLSANNPGPANGAFNDDTWANLSWLPGYGAVSHDVYFGENYDDVADGAPDSSGFRGNQPSTFFVVGFPGFPYPDGLVPGTTYYWRIDEVEADGTTIHKGNVWSFTIPPKTAYAPDPANGAEQIDPAAKLRWTGGFGSKLHTVYFGDNFDDVNNAAGGPPQGATTYTPGTLKLAQTYYWRVDEFDAVETHKGNVWSFTTQGAVGNPNPANGAVDVKQTPILTWSPSVFAASHQLYFGADKDAVKNAGTGSPEYKGTKALGSESYESGKLLWDSTYYWRIDEVNNVNPDSPWVGPVWSFTTANFLIVDDFEDYDIGNNEIWWSWKDGLGYAAHGNEPAYPGNGTGSMVGDETTGSYCEETIVHGGSQSMPLFYDNSFLRYSEAQKTLTYPRDWTENGVSTLTIWFRGISANAAETLYVALNGSAVVTHDNPNAAQIEEWTEWNIDLQAFADQGVNLTNVDTLALGLGNRNNPVAGGSGTMYFDDIRLYLPPEPAQ
ncbi:MAG: LamG-like jellyroll fold domain-containing protein [Sedimentisphaerales bacterium]